MMRIGCICLALLWIACALPGVAEGHVDFVIDAAEGTDLDARVQALDYGEGASFRLVGVFDTGATFLEEVSLTLWEGTEIGGPLVLEKGGELFCYMPGDARVSGGVRAAGGAHLSLTNLTVDGGVSVGVDDSFMSDHSCLYIAGEVDVTAAGEGVVGVFSAGDIFLDTDAALSVRCDCQGTWGVGLWAKGNLDLGPYASLDSEIADSTEGDPVLDVIRDTMAIQVDWNLDARLGSSIVGIARELGSGVGVYHMLTLHPLATVTGEGYSPDNFGIAAGALYTSEGTRLDARGTARGIWVFAQDAKEFYLSPGTVVASPVLYFSGEVETLPDTTFFYEGEPPVFETYHQRIDPPPGNMHPIPWPEA